MKQSHWLLLVCAAFVSGALLVSAQSTLDPAKEADIRRLISLTGTTDAGQEIGQTVTDQVRPALEGLLPPGSRTQTILNTFEQKIRARYQTEELTELTVPIYDRNLTHQEVRDILAFYETPLGRRMLEILPTILEESQDVTAEWSERNFQQIILEMEQEFPELRDLRPSGQQPPR